MFFEPKNHKIFLYNGHVDMRKGHSSLSMLITKKTKFEIMEGHIFLFISKNRKTLKGLFFDGSGLVLIHKRIESGRFMSSDLLQSPLELFKDEFDIIFHGGGIPLSRNGVDLHFPLTKKMHDI